MSEVEDLTNLAKPSSDATLTIRCIKNFEYRTCKNLVLQHVNLETCTAGELKKVVMDSKYREQERQKRVNGENQPLKLPNRNPFTVWLETLFECSVW